MSAYHAAIATSEDYIERRAKHRQAHLDRILGLRTQGLVVAGGPAPDGRTADLFYRAQQRSDVIRLVGIRGRCIISGIAIPFCHA